MFERDEINRRVDVKQLHILLESDPIPQLPIAVRKGMDKPLSEALRTALVNLHTTPAGAASLKRLGATRFEPAQHTDYTFLQHLIAE